MSLKRLTIRVMTGTALSLALVGCGSSNPLLGKWQFDHFGSHSFLSALNSLKRLMGGGRTLKFTDSQMVVTNNGQVTANDVFYQKGKNDKIITFFVKRSNGVKQGMTAHLVQGGQEFYIDLGNRGLGDIRVYYKRVG